MKSLEDRLWEKVDRRGLDECWPWTGCTVRGGYGYISKDSKGLRTHRVAHSAVNGPIPDGLFVLHTCDNPPCCNPRHLFLGTQLVNMLDKKEKGRNRVGVGVRNVNAKLTPDLAVEIRREYVRYSRTHGSRALGRKHGLSHSSILNVLEGVTWK